MTLEVAFRTFYSAQIWQRYVKTFFAFVGQGVAEFLLHRHRIYGHVTLKYCPLEFEWSSRQNLYLVPFPLCSNFGPRLRRAILQLRQKHFVQNN